MTAPSTRRPGGRSARVRAAVLQATLELLVDSGTADVRIADVAERAGVHETTIYRRWPTRDQLVLDALLDQSAELIQLPDTGSLHTDLVALGRELLAYGRSPLGPAFARTMAGATDDGETSAMRERFWEARQEAAQVLVERAKERGELDSGVDGRQVVELFVAPIHFRLLLTQEPVDGPFLERLADSVIRAFGW